MRHALRPKKDYKIETGFVLCETRAEAEEIVFLIEPDQVLCNVLLQVTVPVTSGGIHIHYETTASRVDFLGEIQTRDLLDMKHKC